MVKNHSVAQKHSVAQDREIAKNLIRFTWKIGGEAGFGIKSAGISFAKACFRAGYSAFDYTEYPSLIRGGHNTYQITVSDQDVFSVDAKVDILVALNRETEEKHLKELVDDGVILYDADEIGKGEAPVFPVGKNIQFLSVPFKTLAASSGGQELMRNTVALGATLAILGLPPKLLEDVLKDIFAKKPAVVDLNIQAMRRGYEYVTEHFFQVKGKFGLKEGSRGNRMYISGNEAIAMGALAAGCNFYSGYPMTPSTEILHYMARNAVREGVIFKHAEDEISVINMALGAAHVGARAMCATSGGGFSLMTETLGLAGITETPVVIVNVQRPGPATGLPTWTEQADLRFMLHAAQGEFPRIILAPGSIEECFYLTAEAFNFAEKYQMPVIILSDKTLSEGNGSAPVFDASRLSIERGKLLSEVPGNYRRYEVTPDGISPRTLPGMKGGVFCANSDEHNEYGFSLEDGQNRSAQVEKRGRKLLTAAKELNRVGLYGEKNAPVTLVCWGSTLGAVRDAVSLLPKEEARQFRILHFNVLWPFPACAAEILSKSKRNILIEGNSDAQLGGLIRQMTGIEIREKILKYDGRAFFGDGLYLSLRERTERSGVRLLFKKEEKRHSLPLVSGRSNLNGISS